MIPESFHEEQLRDFFGDLQCKETVRSDAIFVLFTNRCGSNFVTAEMSALALAGPPTDDQDYEFFNSEFAIGHSKKHGIESFASYVHTIGKQFCSPSGYFTSKASIEQLAFLTRCGVVGTAFTRCRFIHVIRRNIVAQAVSWLIAEQTGQWTSLHQRPAIEPKYDGKMIMDLISTIAVSRAYADAYFAAAGTEPLTLYFEDVAGNPDLIRAKLEGFLGCNLARSAEPTLRLTRQATGLNAEWEKRFRTEAQGTLQSIITTG